MSLIQFTTLLTQITTFLIGLFTFIDFLRQRSQPRLDIALMFTDLAVIVLAQWLSALFPGRFPWTGQLGALLLVAQPYLLLRLVNHLRPVSSLTGWIGLAGLLVSWLLVLISPGSIPAGTAMIIVIYMIYIEGVATLILIRGARSTRGVSHWRLMLGALGSLLLIGYLAAAGISAAIPAGESYLRPLIQIFALGSMLSYYVGFATPNWLRRAWQFSEFYNFTRTELPQWVGQDLEQKLQRLSIAAERAVGGEVAAVALWDQDQEELVLAATSNPLKASKIPSLANPAIQNAWREKAPALVSNPGRQGKLIETRQNPAQRNSLLVAPIATPQHAWGLLLVVLDRIPLFAAEDLQLLALFNDQAATALGYERLLGEQLALIEQLRNYNRRLEALNEIDRAILAARSTREIASRALQSLCELAPSQEASVTLFDLQSRQGQLIAVSPTIDAEPREGALHPMDDFPPFEVFKTDRKVSYLEDLEAENRLPPVLETLRSQGIHSVMYTPLVAEDRLIGVIALSSNQISAYQAQHQEILREVADHLAIGIQQAHLREQLQQTNLELERRVEERTLELQNTVQNLQEEIAARQQASEALKIAQERLKQRAAELNTANKELEAFAYSVSHDLRAPLRAIDGFSHILLNKHASRLDEDGIRYLNTICANTQQMGQLIDDLLSFSRLNRQPLNVQEVDPGSLIRLALHDLEKEQEGREVEIVVNGALPSCQADPVLLRQVFINLISNALKFTSKQENAKIEINCLHENGETVFYVKDNGVGFDMRYADKLFGVFQRLHRSDEFEGTGVGLAIVQRVIHRHGGRVWAEGEVNHGATFYFTIPDNRQAS